MATTHGALDGKVILVSGVGPGLGRAVASEALRGGARVVLGDLDGARVRAILSDLGADEDAALAVEADIRSFAACEELVSVARSAFGRVDGLVHVAALDTPVGGLLDGDLDDWSAVAEVNVKGTLQLTKLAVPLLRDSGAGSVVMVGSIAAAGPVEGVVQLAYGMSKAALAVGAYYLSRELGPLGIRVNTVAPGWKWGPTLEDGMAQLASSRRCSRRDAGRARSRTDLSPPVRDRRDVADSVVFLLSDATKAITGQTVYVDGGICH